MDLIPDIMIKAALLSNGLKVSRSVLSKYGLPFLEKRRAYGNPDPNDMRELKIPQELYTLPGKLITSVNIKQNSKWELIHENGAFFVSNQKMIKSEVTFPLRPKFYDQMLPSGEKTSQIITLYGGSALGVFVNGKCHLSALGQACHFCSILQNRSKVTDFKNVITPNLLESSLKLVFQDQSKNIKQIMINGGNFKDRDKNYLYYSDLAILSMDTQKKFSSKELDVHLIVFPPKDYSLVNNIKDSNIGLIVNTEVFNKKLFRKYCPGKEKSIGRDSILKFLEYAANILGKDKVYSVLIGGLEPIESLVDGLYYLAERGITPIINILHTDPDTPLENFPNPSINNIFEMGKALEEVYTKYDMKPCYEDCGRNSIDTESYKKLFSDKKCISLI